MSPKKEFCKKKFRIRWYNKSNIFTEEIKISSIEGRFKYQKKH